MHRFISIADEPTDNDDLRLRKRVGVVVGLLTVAAPLGVPFFGGGSLISYVMGIGMSGGCVLNLVLWGARVQRGAAWRACSSRWWPTS